MMGLRRVITISSILLFAVLGVVVFGSFSIAAEVPEITAEELKHMMEMEDPLVINTVSLIEHNDLHIEGSINIPLEEVQKKLPQDKERKFVFYCLGRT